MGNFLKLTLCTAMVAVLAFTSLQVTAPSTTSGIVAYATIVSTMTDEEYQKVLQQNVDKMEHINSYTAEFVVDYVTPSRDYDQVVDTLNQVQALSDSICEGTSSDYDKVKLLHDYVSENVYYDFEAKEDFANLETISLKHVLETKRTICAGYANLFSALCNAQGIYCVNVRGSVRTSDNPDIAPDDAPTNHEWTAVWLETESRWVYVDCTWDSRNQYYSEDNVETNPHQNVYFDIPLEEISKNHKAKIVDYRNFFDAVNYFSTDETSTIETTTTQDDTQQVLALPIEENSVHTAESTNDTSPNVKSVLVCAMATLMGIMVTGVKRKR